MEEKSKINISPIFYMGNKKRLINKGLIKLFPKDINVFFDVFGGSGVVSLNVSANEIYLNDKDTNLYNLYKMFKDYNCNDIIGHIKNNINKYGLALERTKRNKYFNEEKLLGYKKAYIELRNQYNKTRNILDFYTLMFYSFSQQFRFNSKGEFNMPIGNDFFSDNNEEYIRISHNKFKSLKIGNYDFRYFMDSITISKEDFVYLDPPYFNTTATYNEKGGWTEEDENDLLYFCDELTKKGIRFGMSNIFESKGKINQHLIEWCNKNNYNVYTFDKFSYMACGKGNSNAKEVYICNY